MENNISTVAYRSNIYPVSSASFRDDRSFLNQVHDPFSLEQMKKQGFSLSSFQEREYRQASVHCSYAFKDDYPWGTIIKTDGKKAVICKCTNTECRLFDQCRPDFDPAELDIYEENKHSTSLIFSLERMKEFSKKADDHDREAANVLLNKGLSLPETESTPEHVFDPFVTVVSPENDPAFFVSDTSSEQKAPSRSRIIDFSSFEDVSQATVIEQDPAVRVIVNAGPGTGKTWTLIEKIIYMITEEKASAENILVLCFSRAAVDVIKARLSEAASAGRLGWEWKDVDIRTFDSFATYMLAWIQKEFPSLLPSGFSLDFCDYEQRIAYAKTILEKKNDVLVEYEQIIVDEVQDLVGSRAEMVLALLKGLPDSCGFTLLGDACQSLYDYLAADNPTLMSSDRFYHQVFSSFPAASYYTLTENHRQGDDLGATTISYRNAILTGTGTRRSAEAALLQTTVPSADIRLQEFSRTDALSYIREGTLGILTRTNGQALQISAWLRNSDIPHALLRGLGTPELGDWIAKLFSTYPNETADEASFIAHHLSVFPETDYDSAKERWAALVDSQIGEPRNRYEIKDLLYGLIQNARESLLFQSGKNSKYTITVSNIHRAKGQEFDSVIVIDDVIETMAQQENDDILEHKVCYVALTRPKKRIERVSLPTQYIYITPNETRRCSKASRPRPGKRPYISHFEVGADYDLDRFSFAETVERQEFIRNSLKPGMRLKLKKQAGETAGEVTYSIVVEDMEHVILGHTSRKFISELDTAMQRMFKITSHIKPEIFPHAFCDIYVGDITSYISSSGKVPSGARVYGNVAVWSGFTIKGFAAVDRDTY